MVVALEQAKIAEQQLSVQAGSNTELQAQVDILKGTIKLLEDQIAIHKSMSETLKAMGDTKDKLCAEQIKAATPTFMDNVKTYTFGAGIGAALLGVILILL